MNNKNLERVIKVTSRFGISDKETLLRRLNLIPEESKKIFEARWGLDGGSYCSNYKLLDKKIGRENCKEEYLKAEIALEKSSYLLNIIDYEEFGFEEAVGLGRLASAIECEICIEDSKYVGKNIYDALEKLEEEEKTCIINTYGLHKVRMKTSKQIAEELSITPEKVRQNIERGTRKLRSSSIRRTFNSAINEKMKQKEMQMEKNLREIKGNLKSSENDPHISELGFSTRTENYLLKAGIDTVEKLSKCSVEDLKAITNFGKGLDEILTTVQMLSIN